ncbi:MAG TPA: carboxypeptidase-like regulatory domain-containing protein, partial [Planctomycetota bacterium]|nr:carboxypeptidase-like regulatory domain-containing protein [Planctomycetota bacterium]
MTAPPPPGTKKGMRASHALAAVFVVLLALVLWLGSGSDPPPDLGPTQPKARAEPAAVETSGNKRSLVDAGEPDAPADSNQPHTTGNLHIVVHDERGEALAACAVRAAGQEGRTDATGSVTFTVAAGRMSVEVEPPAGSPLCGRSGWQTVRANSTTELTIVLGSVGNVQFWTQLVAAEDGHPLPGVELFAQSGSMLLRSDAEGFVQTVIANDDTWIDARPAGRCQCRIVPEAGHETRATALRVPLTTGATLSVQVLDTAATPVAGVGLELRLDPWPLQFPPGSRARGTEFVWRAGSDLGGRLSFAGLPIGMTFHVTTRATDSFAALEEQRWTLTSAQEERIITLARGSGVHGTVTDESGAAVAGVTVLANVPEGPSRPRALRHVNEPHRTTTASDGSFRLGGLGAGLWWIGISYGGKYQPTSVSVEVAATGSVQVALQAIAGLPVAGRVLAPDGSAAIGVLVEVGIDGMFVATKPTDDEGSFRFANLPAGPCELRIHEREAFNDLGLAEPVTIEAGVENVELRLQAVNGSISG